MELYSESKEYKLYHGSMLDMLEKIEPNSVDAIITDPPYELNFMNKGWDNSGIAFQKETWQKCYEVLKPGGHLLAFGGSRTFHRIACAIEDAGFEIRDTIMWLYGSGFPKSMNIGLAIDKRNGVDNRTGNIRTDGKATLGDIYEWANGRPDTKEYEERKAQNEWEGWGTCLKPAYEPILVCRKPVEDSIVDNVIKYGVGGLNIDECRVENTNADSYDLEKRGISKAKGSDNDGHFLDKLHNQDAKHGVVDNGRFPANVILTYDETDYEEVCGGMPYTKGNGSEPNYEKSNSENRVYMEGKNTTWHKSGAHFDDEGSAARYFYCAKATKFDRDEGLNEFKTLEISDGCKRSNAETSNKFGSGERFGKNIHPTVKPVSLIRYLVRLISPKGATILDCFNGSESTGKAVMLENKEFKKDYKYIGIELTDEYLPISKARIEYIINNEFDFEKNEETKISDYKPKNKALLDIFDFGVEDNE